MDYYHIFKTLNENSIEYIVVGGLALNLHGIPRMTYDIDLLVNFEGDSMPKMLSILQEWGFLPRIPDPITDVLDNDKRQEWIEHKNLIAFTLYNDHFDIREIDIIISSPVSYSEAIQKIISSSLIDISIPTMCIEHLIKMKEDTGRLQDRMDIDNLRKLVDERA